MRRIRCEAVLFGGLDSARQQNWFAESHPADGNTADEGLARAHWQHYWDCCLPCSHPDRTGGLRSVLTIANFYSARQWPGTGMYGDLYQPQGIDHELMLTLPADPGKTPGPGRPCGCSCSAALALTSPRPAPCSHCCARTCIRPTWTPDAAATHCPSSPHGTGSCWTRSPRDRRHPDRPAARPVRGHRPHPPGKHLQPAASLQPHSPSHPRPSRTGIHALVLPPGHTPGQGECPAMNRRPRR